MIAVGMAEIKNTETTGIAIKAGWRVGDRKREGALRGDCNVSTPDQESGFTRDPQMGKSGEGACFVDEELGSGVVLLLKW